MARTQVTPIVLADNEYRPYNATTDYLHADEVDKLISTSIVANSIYEAQKNDTIFTSLFRDYPDRDKINRRSIQTHYENKLHVGPVTLVQGDWKLGRVRDTQYPHYGTHLAYRLVIDLNETVAVDNFTTTETNTGVKEYIYRGTRYFAPATDKKVYIFSTSHLEGRGIEVPHNQGNTQPHTIVKSWTYWVVRKLVAGEQATNVKVSLPELEAEDYYKITREYGF